MINRNTNEYPMLIKGSPLLKYIHFYKIEWYDELQNINQWIHNICVEMLSRMLFKQLPHVTHFRIHVGKDTLSI